MMMNPDENENPVPSPVLADQAPPEDHPPPAVPAHPGVPAPPGVRAPPEFNADYCYSISATKEVFESAAPEYQQALDRSGYDHKLVFEPPSASLTKKKNRRKNTTWFNPPFSLNVKSNVGKDFLKLIETAFPPSNPLHKLFTRQTLKLSYKCMPSMAQAISRHNAQLLKGDQQLPSHPACNCRAGVAQYRVTASEVELYTKQQ